MTTIGVRTICERTIKGIRFRVDKVVSGDLSYSYDLYVSDGRGQGGFYGPIHSESMARVKRVAKFILKNGLDPVIAENSKLVWDQGYPLGEQRFKYLTGKEAEKYAMHPNAYGDQVEAIRKKKGGR